MKLDQALELIDGKDLDRALSFWHLARHAWPVGERELTSGDISEVQFLLSRAGFDTLGIDGMIGPNTTNAARAYQVDRGLVADGYVGPDLLEMLRSDGR